MLALRTATLSTPSHLTPAPRVRNCLAICPNSTSLHSLTRAQLAAMGLKSSHALVFTTIPGTSPARVFTKPITTRKWSTQLMWTWPGAITPSRLPVLPADMTIGTKRQLFPCRERRGLYLLISDSPPRQHNGSIHTTAPLASHDKWWTNSWSRGSGAVRLKHPGPVLLTGREQSDWKTCRLRTRPATQIRSTTNR